MEPTIRQYLMDFLTTLERILPPPAQCHHAIMLNTRPGEPTYLAVHTNINGRFHSCFIEEKDFEQSPQELAGAVHGFVTRPLITPRG